MATPATVATTEYATAEAASISRPPLRSSSIAPIRAYQHRPASANAFLQASGRDDLARYVDPAMVAVISALFLRVPVRLIVTGLREVLTMAPEPAVMNELWTCVRDVEARYGFAESFLRASKVGPRRDLEIDFVVDDTSKAQDVHEFDAVRQELHDRLESLGYRRSMVVTFTADRRWAM